MKMNRIFKFTATWLFLAAFPVTVFSGNLDVKHPDIVLRKVPFSISIESSRNINEIIFPEGKEKWHGIIRRTEQAVIVDSIVLKETGKKSLSLKVDSREINFCVRVIPGWVTLLPPLVAIALALLIREMIVSLFAGIWIGVSVICNYNLFQGFLTSLREYIVQTIADSEHASILVFTLLFGGMIGIINRNGGMYGIVKSISRYARTRRSGQLYTSLAGLIIFFDDYSNTLLVGNTMRPFTDRLKISREKLAYIVDSTAAPVAGIAFISTWSVFQMSLLNKPFELAGIDTSTYIVFLKSIPYNFYCIFAIFFLFVLGFTRRDFGPMRVAEVRAIKENKVLRDGAQPLMDDSVFHKAKEKENGNWLDGVIPIAVVVISTILGLYFTGLNGIEEGEKASLHNIIGHADAYSSLMWASAFGGIVAIILSLARKTLNLRTSLEAWLSGLRSMMLAVVILVLAWTIGQICIDLKTADYVVHIARGIISPSLLPFVTFITAAFVSFSTGTSWGTMSILVPLVAPLALNFSGNNVNSTLFLSSFAAILSGATFGDHCSPISDTTILSSMASGSDHIDHVRTQLPYAVTVALVAGGTGYILIGLGLSYPIPVSIMSLLLVLIVLLIGKRLPPE